MGLAQGEPLVMRILALITLSIVLAGCAKGPGTPGDEYAEKVSVDAGAVAELCFDADKDDELLFRFEADQALQFNLHYHIDDEVFYPVPEHETAAEKGQYLVPKDETYCLMWTNTTDTTIGLSARVEGARNMAWY